MKKFLNLLLVLTALAMMLSGCSSFVNQNIGSQPTQEPTTAPQITKEPEKIEATEAPKATETPLDKVIDGAIYLPKANRRIVMREYNGSDPDSVPYISAKDGQNTEEGYKVSSYYEDQAMYYTDYFVNDEGVFGRFSDDENKEIFLTLPKDITEGMEFEADGEKAIVKAVGVDFALENFSGENCVIVKINSNAYGREVTNVYAPELGLAAQYIEYDEEVIDIIKLIDSYEDIPESEAQKTVDDSKF